jgi:hypothetical protein
LAIDIDYFHRTLHKIHNFVEAQQEKTAFKMFFRQGEMTTLLKSCTTGLAQAVDVFMVNAGSVSAYELIEQNPAAQWCQPGQGYQCNEGIGATGPRRSA